MQPVILERLSVEENEHGSFPVELLPIDGREQPRTTPPAWRGRMNRQIAPLRFPCALSTEMPAQKALMRANIHVVATEGCMTWTLFLLPSFHCLHLHLHLHLHWNHRGPCSILPSDRVRPKLYSHYSHELQCYG